jgi:hypothetical protein
MTKPRPWTVPLAAFFLASAVATLAQCGADATAAGSPAAATPSPTTTHPTKPQDPAPQPAIPANVDRIRLLVSGAMLGHLEPCGCASGQLGGLPRRMQHIGEQNLGGRSTYDLLIEGGDMAEGHTELDMQKVFTALQVLFGMQHPYDVLGIGKKDLELPFAEWTSYLAIAPVVATDLTSTAAEWPGKPFLEKQVRGHKIRLLSFTLELPAVMQKDDAPIHLLAPAEAWQRGLQGADDATLRVLLVHAADTKTRELLPKLDPKPDLVLCFDEGYTEPPAHPELLEGVPIVYPGTRGRMLLDVSLARLPSGPRVGYEVLPLQGSKTLPGGGGDPDAKEVLLQHRRQVKADDVLTKMAEQRPTANGASYVGSTTCAGCHQTAYDLWKKTKHGHAWQTLVDAEQDPKRYGWPVTAYPDCVSCHVVGYGETSGFVTAEKTPYLTDVGCERCHGAGSDHVQSGGKKLLGKVGGGMASVVCTQCHDFEQSPDFLYTNKWPLIQHGREPGQEKK